MKSKLLLVIALADVLFFSGWIARESFARSTGREVKLPIEGYDPRDVLSGHYVTFRLIAEREADALLEGPASFCLEDGHVVSVRGSVEPCEVYITRGGQTFGVNRFYVDERLAGEVARVPTNDDTYVVARVDSNGAIHLTQLVVNGNRFSR